MSAPGALVQETDEWREYVGNDVVMKVGEDFDYHFSANEWHRMFEGDVQMRAKVRANCLLLTDLDERPCAYVGATVYLPASGLNNPPHSALLEGAPELVTFGRYVHVQATEGSYGGVQEPMFVNPVEFMETPKRVGHVSLPSVVRLQALDDLLSGRVDPLRLGKTTSRCGVPSVNTSVVSPMKPATAVPVFVPEDRELGQLRDFIGERGTKRRSKFESKLVERRAKVLETITDEQREWIARRREGRDPASLVARYLRVGFFGQGVLCGFEVPGDLVLQILQVTICAA